MDNKNKEAINPYKEITFLVRIQYRHNASWQGTLSWLEGKKTIRFRSLLELILLMQEALEESGASCATCQFKEWKDKEEVS
ncbi:MAG: hypothetical protein D5R97_00130 [Candidatus Syntrophonatronum acetioxidans]|uniref:Uncharacterized protein n=1 Tax=Candidatus Syntrophonatronum acetioxidans TaxID=1795816 RepID=A0A424YJ51_9FIRM|nr:MAG: hypothetical protein D5R97_00130 [Candidatus Syntrophonatronum acetioxidans]